MNVKSERLKKLESELSDLEQWLKLGLVPKKDLEKHKDEMRALQERIDEEKERLRYLKESGELEEYAPPKRTPGRQAYQEPQSMPDMDMMGMDEGMTDAGLDMETESFDMETTSGGEDSDSEEDEGYTHDEEEEDPFSDRNRWRRGILEDPDSSDW